MSNQGTWCDNIIIQAVANAFNCVIYITESNINSPEATIVTPVIRQEGQKTIFIGYIDGLYYVSAVTDRNSQNNTGWNTWRESYQKLKTKTQEWLKKERDRVKKCKAAETDNERQSRLSKQRDSRKKKLSAEKNEKREFRKGRRAGKTKYLKKLPITQKRAQITLTCFISPMNIYIGSELSLMKYGHIFLCRHALAWTTWPL